MRNPLHADCRRACLCPLVSCSPCVQTIPEPWVWRWQGKKARRSLPGALHVLCVGGGLVLWSSCRRPPECWSGAEERGCDQRSECRQNSRARGLAHFMGGRHRCGSSSTSACLLEAPPLPFPPCCTCRGLCSFTEWMAACCCCPIGHTVGLLLRERPRPNSRPPSEGTHPVRAKAADDSSLFGCMNGWMDGWAPATGRSGQGMLRGRQ